MMFSLYEIDSMENTTVIVRSCWCCGASRMYTVTIPNLKLSRLKQHKLLLANFSFKRKHSAGKYAFYFASKPRKPFYVTNKMGNIQATCFSLNAEYQVLRVCAYQSPDLASRFISQFHDTKEVGYGRV